nr:threonine/serine dehydratase [Nocardioides sp.]
ADSLGASQVGTWGFATAVAAGVTSVLVPDEAIVAARHELWASLRLATEPAGAAAYAAVRSGAIDVSGRRVGVVVCGGNASPADL